jgi:uncharacterized protein
MKRNLIVVTLILISLCSLAAETAEMKARFLERKPILDGMKAGKLIGENNLGFLEFRTAVPQTPEHINIVKDENGDRQTIYAEIAAKLNITPAEVGKRRALQIAQQAVAGQWLQDAEGTWYLKS